MSELVQVERELHIAAPEGDAIYVHSPSYVARDGTRLTATVRHEAMHIAADGDKHYYSRRIYRRHSDDNGNTWRDGPDEEQHSAAALPGEHRYPPFLILDERSDVLIELCCAYEVAPDEPFMGIGNRAQRTRRMFYRLSHDGGATWTEPQQVIDVRAEFDHVRWGPGLEHGITGGIAAGQHAFLDDGTLVIGFVVSHPEAPRENTTPRAREHFASTIYAQARLTDDGKALEWRFGDMIHVDFPKSADGCCEPAVTSLGGSRLLNTMRCQGDEAAGIFSTRYTTITDDGGLTWSDPVPLVCDDGDTVWTPASVHRFFSSSKTGKTYLLANILPGPVHGQMPRYPLTIAEFDTERLCVPRNTVQVVQDLPDGAPTQRRYTNWGDYEERGSGDLILLMPEQPKFANFTEMIAPEQYTSDCIKFRLRFNV